MVTWVNDVVAGECLPVGPAAWALVVSVIGVTVARRVRSGG
jgi:hypothetical protein